MKFHAQSESGRQPTTNFPVKSINSFIVFLCVEYIRGRYLNGHS